MVKLMTKINQILTEWIPGDVHSLKWFRERGVEQNMAYEYFQGGALEKLGPGVYSRKKEKPKWQGGIRLLQEEFEKLIHVSGKTALELQGHAHYISMRDKPTILLTAYSKVKIPKWFTSINFECEFKLNNSTLFTEKIELTKHQVDGFQILVSSRELAILEFLSTLELSNSFETAENYMNALQTLRPNVVQTLLEKCTSVKVKRVFLYLSEKLELPYFKKLDLTKIDLGIGKRQVIKENGQLNQKYQITVPRKYEENPF